MIGRHPVGRAVDRRGRFDRVLDAFQSDPDAGIARQRIADETVVDDLLDAGRTEGSGSSRRRRRIPTGAPSSRIRRHGRRPSARARRPRARCRRDWRGRSASPARSTPGPLPYQMPKTPSKRPSPRISACCAPHMRRRGEILVDRRLEDDVARLQNLGRAPELLVEPAQRRAAIAGDISRRVLAGPPVTRLLHQRQPHDRLGSGDQNPVPVEIVFVVEGNRLETHAHSSTDFQTRAPPRQPKITTYRPRSTAYDCATVSARRHPATRHSPHSLRRFWREKSRLFPRSGNCVSDR